MRGGVKVHVLRRDPARALIPAAAASVQSTLRRDDATRRRTPERRVEVHLEEILGKAISRRHALKASAAAVLASQAAVIDQFVMTPQRPAYAAPNFSDIQFNIGASVGFQPSTFNDGAGNVLAGPFEPIFMLLVPARLTRNPTKADQAVLANAL